MNMNSQDASKNQQNKINTDLSKIKNLGHLLQKRRRSLKISLAVAEKNTKIRAHYTIGFVKNYAEYLGFESKPIVDMFKSELKVHHRHADGELKSKGYIGPKPLNSPKWVLTPKTLIFFASLAMLGLILAYIIWQVVLLALPPKLTLNNQPTQEVNANFAFISGKVEGGGDLFINDSPVLTAADGSFREKVSLVDGANLIKVTAKNKLGKSASMDRTIIAKIPANIANKSVQNTSEKVDGVRVVVKISKSATWLIVEADGKEIYRGTMLVGSAQAFEAADDLKITTGNAGSTQLILSDKLVKDKDLGIVGTDGEIKRDLEFKKDTLVK
jgi:cytoskeletal protein RodZ